MDDEGDPPAIKGAPRPRDQRATSTPKAAPAAMRAATQTEIRASRSSPKANQKRPARSTASRSAAESMAKYAPSNPPVPQNNVTRNDRMCTFAAFCRADAARITLKLSSDTRCRGRVLVQEMRGCGT